MEARGEIRGGRFISGYVGEHFALPEAIEALRASRRAGGDGATVEVAAYDPLHFAAKLIPGGLPEPRRFVS
jgi:ATP-dependent Lhr-like helicase